MLDPDQIYESFSGRHLRPAEWEARKQEIVRRAREARSRALRDLFVRLLPAIRALSAHTAKVATRLTHAYATWRANRRAVRELRALGDRTLKDFGIHRSEIESVVYGHNSSQVTEGRIAARLFHKPHVRRARRARGQVLRDLVALVATNVTAAARRWADAYAARRMRSDAIRRLNSFDDRMLGDIGVGRSEIGYLVNNEDPARLPRGKVAATAVRASCARTGITMGPASKYVIEKNAA